MSCERWQDLLLDELYGELAPGAHEALAAHLGGCARCREEREALARTLATVRAAPAAPGPTADVSALLAAADVAARRARREGPRARFVAAVGQLAFRPAAIGGLAAVTAAGLALLFVDPVAGIDFGGPSGPRSQAMPPPVARPDAARVRGTSGEAGFRTGPATTGETPVELAPVAGGRALPVPDPASPVQPSLVGAGRAESSAGSASAVDSAPAASGGPRTPPGSTPSSQIAAARAKSAPGSAAPVEPAPAAGGRATSLPTSVASSPVAPARPTLRSASPAPPPATERAEAKAAVTVPLAGEPSRFDPPAAGVTADGLRTPAPARRQDVRTVVPSSDAGSRAAPTGAGDPDLAERSAPLGRARSAAPGDELDAVPATRAATGAVETKPASSAEVGPAPKLAALRSPAVDSAGPAGPAIERAAGEDDAVAAPEPPLARDAAAEGLFAAAERARLAARYDDALTLYLRVAAEHPAHRRAPEALLAATRLRRDAGDLAGARALVARLDADYRGTPAAVEAHRLLDAVPSTAVPASRP